MKAAQVVSAMLAVLFLIVALAGFAILLGVFGAIVVRGFQWGMGM